MYYDIDTILAEEERIPTRFRYDAHQLGYLDPGSVEEDITKDTKVELPLFLAKMLSKKQLVVLSVPKCYEAKFRSNMNADASVMDLHRYPYYYDVGQDLSLLLKEADLHGILQKAFAQRYKMILDKSQNMRNADTTEFTTRLTTNENKLFEAGYLSSIEYEKWKNRKNSKITTASVINSNRKRKRAEDNNL